MTWVVGLSMLGTAYGFSDIRVECESPEGELRYVDCLQKMHRVGSDIVVGFAGSVVIGLRVVEQMTAWLKPIPEGNAADPLDAVKRLERFARDTYWSNECESEQADGCELIMFSSDPTACNGPRPQAYIHILTSPQFEPKLMPGAEPCGIGAGSNARARLDECIAGLRDIAGTGNAKMFNATLAFKSSSFAGGVISQRLSEYIEGRNPVSISAFLNYCEVTRGRSFVGHWEDPVRPQPQKLVASLDELRDVLAGHGIANAAARC